MSGLLRQLQQAVSSTLSFLRRNRRLITVLGTASAATGVTLAYLLYHYRRVVSDGLRQEREVGLRHLRRQYEINDDTVRELIGGLVRLVQKFVWERTPAEQIVATLRQEDVEGLAVGCDKKSTVDRKSLWERLKILSLSRLLSSVWAIAVVYLQLVARIHLVARYTWSAGSSAMVDIPVKTLPRGKLLFDTQKLFLEGLKKRLFEEGLMNEILDGLDESVERIAGKIPLKERLSAVELKSLLRRISKEVLLTEGKDVLTARHMLMTTEVGAERENMPKDENLESLQGELCDLCELLDFKLVLADCVEQIMEQVDSHLDTVLPVDTALPLAKVLPNLTKISEGILTSGSFERHVSDPHVPEFLSLEKVLDALAQSPAAQRFAAAVFLSGEQDFRN